MTSTIKALSTTERDWGARDESVARHHSKLPGKANKARAQHRAERPSEGGDLRTSQTT